MKDLRNINNLHGDDKVIDACSIFGAMNKAGERFSGESVIKAITNMHDRGNGLGGGFAVYGLYPQYADLYAFHIMYLSQQGKQETEDFLGKFFNVVWQEEVPTRPTSAIKNPPSVWRYFLDIPQDLLEMQSEDENVTLNP